MKKLAQKVEESKGASSAAMSTLATQGIVIQKKCPRDEAPDVTPDEMGSKGKEAMPLPKAKKKAKATPSEAAIREVTRAVAPGEGISANPVVALGPKVTMLRSAATAENSSRPWFHPSTRRWWRNWSLIGWSPSFLISSAR